MPTVHGIEVSQDVLDRNPELRGADNGAPLNPSKYHNARATYAGMTFQSGHEMDVVSKLVLGEEQKAGVFGLRLQVRFPLPGGVTYVADATYLDDNLQVHVIDAKAWDKKTGKFLRTPEYRLKRKLFKAKYGRDIEEL